MDNGGVRTGGGRLYKACVLYHHFCVLCVHCNVCIVYLCHVDYVCDVRFVCHLNIRPLCVNVFVVCPVCVYSVSYPLTANYRSLTVKH